MKNIIIVIFFIALMFPISSTEIITPHLVLIEISRSNGTYPTSDEISFSACLENDEQDIINNNSQTSYYNEEQHILEIQFSDFESYNFVSNQTLNVEVFDNTTNISTSKSFMINNNPAQIYHSTYNNEGIILQTNLPTEDEESDIINPTEATSLPINISIDSNNDNEIDTIANFNLIVLPDNNETNNSSVNVLVTTPDSNLFPDNVPNPQNASIAFDITIDGNSQPYFWIEIPFSEMNILPTEVIRRQDNAWTLIQNEDLQWLPNYETRTSVRIRGHFNNGRGGTETFILNKNSEQSTLPIILTGFTAHNVQNSANPTLKLTWQTASETGLIGFNIWRSESNFYNRIKINNFLIPSSNSTSDGAFYSYFDTKDIEIDVIYYYWLEAIFEQESPFYFGPIDTKIPQSEEDSNVSSISTLIGCFPNPFGNNSSQKTTLFTKIFYNLKEEDKQDTKISIYNIKGQKIKEFHHLASGTKKFVIWNGRDKNNHVVSSGIYFYQLQTLDFVQTKKITFLK